MLRDLVKNLVDGTLKELVDSNILPSDLEFSALIERSPVKGWHFATNTALVLAKKAGMSPWDLGLLLQEKLMVHFPDVMLAKPGFLNFKLSQDHLALALTSEWNNGSYNDWDYETQVVLEFVSANPTGPISVVNGKAAVLGSVLSKLFEFNGISANTIYYVNDGPYSTQLEAMANSLMHFMLPDQYEFPENGYKGQYVKELAESFKNKVDLNSPNLKKQLKKLTTQYYMHQHNNDLDALGVNYSQWVQESFLYAENKVWEVINELKNNNCTYEQDGALMLKTACAGDEKDRVLVRENGNPTYLASDLAFHDYKLFYGWGQTNMRLINIMGADHHGYIKRLETGLRMIGSNAVLETILTQMVEIVREDESGQKVKVVGGKRDGNILELKSDLIDVIGKDAARWYFADSAANSHTVIDVDKAKAQSVENPVFYVQYTNARMCSLLDKVELEDEDLDTSFLNLVESEIEIELALMMADFNFMTKTALDRRSPMVVTQYAYNLASLFNQFYDTTKVVPLDGNYSPEAKMRVMLVILAQQSLAATLEILGISAPENMYRDGEGNSISKEAVEAI